MPALSSDPLLLALVALGAYLLGSIPFGLVVARAMGLGDLRAIGSGNIGATNVLRTGNKRAAFLTLVLDAGKGAAAVLLARRLFGGDAGQVAALAAFAGHLVPVFAGFRGGKGVATFLGVLLALDLPVGLVTCVTWLAAAFAFRISSLGALTAAGLAPVWAALVGGRDEVLLALVLALLVYWRHRANIERLLAGTEPRIGAGKP